MRREMMDGIQPMMDGTFYIARAAGRTVDNYVPPIFNTVILNRHINLWLILSLGGNPNIRYMGMTALHLAVKPRFIKFLVRVPDSVTPSMTSTFFTSTFLGISLHPLLRIQTRIITTDD